MLLSHFHIVDDSNDEYNDIAYIQGWASHLKDHTQEIVKAASQAEKAMQYFLETAGKMPGITTDTPCIKGGDAA